MSRAIFVHADGTDCHHQGPPSTSHLEKPPHCPGHRPITAVRLNNSPPIQLAPLITSLKAAAANFAAVLSGYTDAINGLTSLAGILPPDLAAAAAFTARYSDDGLGPAADPCGAGPLPAQPGSGR